MEKPTFCDVTRIESRAVVAVESSERDFCLTLVWNNGVDRGRVSILTQRLSKMSMNFFLGTQTLNPKPEALDTKS